MTTRKLVQTKKGMLVELDSGSKEYYHSIKEVLFNTQGPAKFFWGKEYGAYRFEWTVETVTTLIRQKLLDPKPVAFQRLLVATEKWNEKFIRTILKNGRTNVLHIRLLKFERATMSTTYTRFCFQLIDGLQRISSLIAFINNEFASNGQYFRELTPNQQKQIMEYEFTIIMYDENMTDAQASAKFIELNDTNELNKQEKLNSVHSASMEAIRAIARTAGLCDRHEVFNIHSVKNPKTKRFEDKSRWNKIEINRLGADALATWAFTATFKNKNAKSNMDLFRDTYEYSLFEKVITEPSLIGVRDEHENIIKDGEYLRWTSELKELIPEVTRRLDYLLRMDKALNDLVAGNHVLLGEGGQKLLMKTTFFLEAEYRGRGLSLTFDKILADEKSLLTALTDYIGKYSDPKTRTTAERDYFKKLISGNTHIDIMEFMYGSVVASTLLNKKKAVATNDIKGFIPFLMKNPTKCGLRDPVRKFTNLQKRMKLSQQKGLCWVDGLPLKWEDAVAAHIRSWTDRGATTSSNLAMVRKIHNQNSGAMDLRVYKRDYQERMNARQLERSVS